MRKCILPERDDRIISSKTSIVTTSIDFWQVSSLLWQAGQRKLGNELEPNLVQQLNGVLGCSCISQWSAAIEALLQRTSTYEDGYSVNPDSDAMQTRLSAIDALQKAWHAFQTRQLQEDRFKSAVEHRVAESMYNFCYGLTHEINNPLANISARAQGLKSKSQDPAVAQSLDNIVRQSHRAHEMLAEMMLAVRPPTMRMQMVDLKDFAEECAEDFHSQAEAAQLSFEFTIDDHQLPVMADVVALREALQAILTNSINACEVGGSIHFQCLRIDVDDPIYLNATSPRIRLAICDNGAGLTASQIAQAFDLYFCGREAGRSLGIGLSKAKRIVDAHQGTITIQSEASVGTDVEIILPWARHGR